MSRRIKPADERNDGSGGAWIGGLPADVAGTNPPTTIDYDAQAGTPSDQSGGSYKPNVTGSPAPSPALGPTPFKPTK